MKLLKFISVLLISTTLLVSCGPNKPDNKIHETTTEQTGWKPGPTPKDKPVAVIDTFVKISPTWGQANQYSRETKGQGFWGVIGVLLFAAFVVVLWGVGTNASWVPDVNNTVKSIAILLLFIGSFVAFKGRAASIKWNNDKWISKEQFDGAIKQTGSTQPIWDSLRNGCHIAWGPSECFKK